MKKYIYILFIFLIGLSEQSCLRHHVDFSKDDGVVNTVKVFPTEFLKGLYKTNIVFWGKDYSGLIFFKKYLENKETRMVFMSEFGLKLFDFKLDNNGEFTVEYIIEELNNDKFIKVLEQDMKLLFPVNDVFKVKSYETKDENINAYKFKKDKKRYYYFINNNNEQVSKIEYSGSLFKNIKIGIDDYINDVPSYISIKHINIFLSLELKLIK